jgi:4-diphosphocytidyl-2-C-methyl-D-erythritol kinase
LRAARHLSGILTTPSALALDAAKVGSDTAFFAYGGTCVVSGRGEIVKQIEDINAFSLVLLLPDWRLEAKTATLFGLLEPEHYDLGTATDLALRELDHRNSTDAYLMANTFEKVADRAFPDLRALRRTAERQTGLSFMLSGAGPSLFALADSPEHARRLASELSGLCRAEAARSVTAAEASLVEVD